MELNKNEFSFTNNIFDNDIDYMVELIDKEIVSLNQIRKNINKFVYMEAKKNTISLFKFNRVIDESSRIVVEIATLENKKLEYIKIKENL